MGLFGKGFTHAGSGISKTAPKKKGFFRYWELFREKFWKLIELNIFYTLFFIPLIAAAVGLILMLSGSLSVNVSLILVIGGTLLFMILFGPATAGMMKIMRNFFVEKPTFLVHDFLKTFRSEFGHSAIFGFLDCLLVCCVAASFYVYPKLAEQTGSKIYYVMLIVTLSISLVAILMNFYLFLMIVSTNLSMKNIFRNSFYLGIVCMKQNLFSLGILAVVAGGILLLALKTNMMVLMIILTFLPFIPGTWLALMVTVNSYPSIQKYIINPYYEKRGEVNPEIELTKPASADEAVFSDMGGMEKPVDLKVQPVKTSKNPAKEHKGKIIS